MKTVQTSYNFPCGQILHALSKREWSDVQSKLFWTILTLSNKKRDEKSVILNHCQDVFSYSQTHNVHKYLCGTFQTAKTQLVKWFEARVHVCIVCLLCFDVKFFSTNRFFLWSEREQTSYTHILPISTML